MAHPTFNDIGSYLVLHRSVSATAVAAGTGDATETNGAGINRIPTTNNYRSAVFFLLAQATLSAGKKATFKATIQDSADDSTYADVAAICQPQAAADSVRAADAVVLTLSSVAGDTQVGAYQTTIDLQSLRQYVRAQVYVDLDAGATDTAFYTAGFAFGGASSLPI